MVVFQSWQVLVFLKKPCSSTTFFLKTLQFSLTKFYFIWYLSLACTWSSYIYIHYVITTLKGFWSASGTPVGSGSEKLTRISAGFFLSNLPRWLYFGMLSFSGCTVPTSLSLFPQPHPLVLLALWHFVDSALYMLFNGISSFRPKQQHLISCLLWYNTYSLQNLKQTRFSLIFSLPHFFQCWWFAAPTLHRSTLNRNQRNCPTTAGPIFLKPQELCFNPHHLHSPSYSSIPHSTYTARWSTS